MESPLQTIERLQQQVRDLEAQLAAAQQGAQLITGPCGQCKDSRTPCACSLDTMLKERGLVAVDEAHYLKISQQAKSNTHPTTQWLDARKDRDNIFFLAGWNGCNEGLDAHEQFKKATIAAQTKQGEQA